MNNSIEKITGAELAEIGAPHQRVEVSEARQVEFINLITNASGVRTSVHRAQIEEAMGASDFPYLLGQVLERQLLAKYQGVTPTWKQYIRTGMVSDFRVTHAYKTWGGALLQRVNEFEEYKAAAMYEGKYQRQVYKYGQRRGISWEAIINDALGAFGDITGAMAQDAMDTEYYLATSLVADASGPHASLFGATVTDAADGAAITNKGALPLTIANLETTIQLMRSQLDKNGRPMMCEPRFLVVPPKLEMTARALLSSSVIIGVGTTGSAAYKPATNVIPQVGLQLIVNPWLPIIDLGGKADATWYLFAEPSRGAAAEVTFMRGHEAPKVAIRASDVQGAAPQDGDFDHDMIQYRVRHVIGTAHFDPRFAYAQTGS